MTDRYDNLGFFARLSVLFRGIGQPCSTRAYKLARIELQRLVAPLLAIVVPLLFGVVLAVVTAVSANRRLSDPVVDIRPIAEPEPPPPPPPPPDPPEYPPIVEPIVDFMAA
ncbi:MAG: hypothetical protein IJ649_08120, partial [Oscillospiraceae bacterium]|nr:hypothetical protein [Oscillospiraceae bacterium]